MLRKKICQGELGLFNYPLKQPFAAIKFILLLAGLSSSSIVVAQDTDANSEEVIEEIVVTGIANSLKKSIDVKRSADSIVESLRAEDIGKLPDVSIADSLGRLPGVTVERERGNGSTVSVRGLGPDLVTALLNGREIVTAEQSRVPNFQQFPSELINGADVYKSSTAAKVEGGLAATIDLATIRPLSVGSQIFQIGAQVYQNSIADELTAADDYGNRLNFSYIDQFLDDSLGVAIGFARLDQPVSNVRANVYAPLASFQSFSTPPNTEPGGDGVPNGFEFLVRGGEDIREAGLLAVEWQATDDLFVYYDALYSNTQIRDDQVGFRVDNITFGNTLSNVVLEGTNAVALDASKTFPWGVDAKSVNERYWQDDEFFANGLNVAFQATDALSANLDLGYSRVKRDGLFATIIARPRDVNNQMASFDLRPSVPSLDISADLTDISETTGIHISQFSIPSNGGVSQIQDELFAASLDFELAINDELSAEFGVRSSDRKKQKDAASQVEDFLALDPTSTINPDSVRPSILGSYDGPLLNNTPNFLTLDFDSVLNDLGVTINPTVAQNGEEGRNSWQVEEDTVAVYTQLNFDSQISGLRVFGNAGLRYIETKQSVITSSLDAFNVNFDDSAAVLLATDKTLDYVLPSFNATLAISEKQQVRFALSKAISRAPLDDLGEGFGAFGVNGLNPQSNNGFPSIASFGGNQDLEPYEADQVDLTYEFYFADSAAVTLSAFYKELDTFIVDISTIGPLDVNRNGVIELDEQIVVINRPENGEGGIVKGAEILYQQPLSFLPEPFDGLGVYATYSYTDSSAQIDQDLGGDTIAISQNIRGLARHVGAATLWYSKNNFEASFNYRFKSDFSTRQGRDLVIADSEGNLQFQTSYNFDNGVTVFFQASNLTDERYRTYYQNETQLARDEDYGRFYYLGLKYKLQR